MPQFCCVLCGAFFLKLAGSSFSGSTLKVLIQLNSTKFKAPLDQFKSPLQLNSTKDKLKAPLDQLKSPLQPNSTKKKLNAPLDQLKEPLESHSTKDKVPLESISTRVPVSASGNGHNHHKALRQKPRLPMLKLMSLNLENWGARSVHHRSENLPESIMVSGNANFEPFVRGDANSAPFYKGDASFLAFDQILSSDGGEAPNRLAQAFEQILSNDGDHLNPLAQVPNPMNMFDSRAQQVHPLSFAQYGKPQRNLAKNLMLVILASVILLLMSCWCCDRNESDEEDKEAAMSAPIGKFTWAAAYLEAEGEQRDAFELLFRCNMISADECSHGAVSQEHIQECTRIAKHMLQHKTLEEWVGLWQLARGSFEDPVRLIGMTLSLLTPSSLQTSSRPSSSNLDFVSDDPCDASLKWRPLHS